MKILDLESLLTTAKKHKITSVVDNTFCSPVIQSPILLGADIVYHSATKYLGGHSDLVMGALIVKDKELHSKLALAAMSIGANPSPFDCYLVLRSLKTLEARVIKATHNGYHLAHFMEHHECVENVIYPGLKSNPMHEIAKKQMRGYGGMLSFRIKGGK
jgi:cystathionine gamma-lyase